MSHVTLDGTGVLSVAGKKVFPLGLSNPPPLGKQAPSGKQGLAEVAEGGITLMRTGIETWSLADFDGQIAQQRALLDGAAAAGLLCWLWLGNAASHPVSPTLDAGDADDEHRQHVQGTSRARRLEGSGRAGEPAARAVQAPRRGPDPRLQEAEDARSRPAARDHPGAARKGGGPAALPSGVRHHGRRHLPDLVSAGIHTDTANPDITRRRRHDAEDAPGRRLEAGLDDAADRLERHGCRRPTTRTRCPAFPRSSRSGSWRTRRSSTARAA